MIAPVASPNFRTMWPRTATDWATWRMARKAIVFPDGIPTDEVDSVTDDWIGNYQPGILPLGASKVLVLHDLTPGGRSGGTSLHCDLCIPTAAPIGKLAIYLQGHGGDAGQGLGWDYWCQQLRASGYAPPGLIEGFLARGFHVLVADMPDGGSQPHPQMIRVNGTVQRLNGHDFSALDSDGGPSAMQMFCKHQIRAITTALRISGASSVTALCGHSGGGSTGALLASMDDRIDNLYILQGGSDVGWDQYPLGNYANAVIQDYESYYSGNKYYTPLPRRAFGASAIAAAAFPGRRTHWCVGLDDISSISSPTNTDKFVNPADYYRAIEDVNDIIRPSGGVIFPFLQAVGGGHGPAPDECDYVLSDIEDHL